MRNQKAGLRKEYRREQAMRVDASKNLATSYPQLKSLTIDLVYFDHEIVAWGHGLKYRANLEAARSMLRFACPSALCRGGDFDLSRELSAAISEHRTMVAGEMHCPGSRDEETGGTIRCGSVLHYKMGLAFRPKQMPGAA